VKISGDTIRIAVGIIIFLIVIVAIIDYLRAEEVSSGTLTNCSEINDEEKQKACYDKLFSEEEGEEEEAPSHPDNAKNIRQVSGWTIYDEDNPIDDTITVTMLLEADGGNGTWEGSPYLVIRCKSNVTDLYIVWHEDFDNNTEITTRVGDAEAITSDWLLSTDVKASFYPDNPVPFINDMEKSSQFIAKGTPYRKSPVTAIFNTEGLKDAIKSLQEKCDWE